MRQVPVDMAGKYMFSHPVMSDSLRVSEVAKELGDIADALIGLHCFTWRDSMSGKGKMKAY